MENFLALLDLSVEDGRMILVCVVIFFCLWKLSNKFLFGPFIRLVEAREEATSGALVAADEKNTKAAEITKEYDQQLVEQRVASLKEKLTVINQARAEATEIISAAEDKAEERIRAARKEIGETIDSIKAAALQDADAIADQIVNKLKAPLQAAKSSLD